MKTEALVTSGSVWVTLEERKEARRKVLWALFISILCHLLLILLIAWFLHDSRRVLPLQKNPDVQEVLLNLVTNAGQYLATDSSQATESRPQKPRFESDNNTRAASEMSAAGRVPMPTLDGHQSEALELQNREYSPGKTSGGSLPSKLSPPTQAQPKETTKAKQQAAAPSLPPTALPILKPEKSHPADKPEETVQPKPANPPPSLARPSSPAQRPGYQSETRVVRIDGNISNRGRAALDVAATPLGRYKKLLSNAIGARWYYLIQRDMDLYRIGTVDIRFRVTPSGKVEAVQVIGNTSNELLAATSIQSITDAEMPPIPPEIVGSLPQGRIEVDYSFSIISN
ncbi:MAG: hypothetical protein C5B47_06430 [Verrucomicrobia bacterium]|nr:MAG: hypothetical protein C5B47_06430 [Verrucomicrobiota bacterium]